MTSELAAHVRLLNDLHFQGSARSGYTIDLDTPACDGGGEGMTPMELVLLSLASCSAMDVAAILRKKRQQVERLEVRVRGQRQSEHPTVFTSIKLEYVVHGSGVDPQAVTRAIELSRERYCPVWAMLEPTVKISAASRVVCDDPILVPAD
jgi:putative redox protein